MPEIRWDMGEWRNCFHQNPAELPEPNTERKMSLVAKKMRYWDIQWGVVNPGNARCAATFRTKREANWYRKYCASAYVVVRVIITPIYTSVGAKE